MREEVTGVWELALERSPPTPDDLNRIPFTLLSFRIVHHLYGTQALRRPHRPESRRAQ